MIRKFFAAALIAGSLVFLAQSASAGPFRDMLFNNFCQDKPYHERVGCNGYLQYRIQLGRDRDRAFELCTWGCGEVMDSSANISDCQKGCQDMNALDH